jgi:hypothetical protein
MSKAEFVEKLIAARRLQDALPYLLLIPGPTIEPCPMHSKYVALVLLASHAYWDENPCQTTELCRCWIRSISKWEIEKLRIDGIQDPFAPPVRDAKGNLTGYREKRFVPIRETL